MPHEGRRSKLTFFLSFFAKVDSALGPGNASETLADGFKISITRGDLATLSNLNWLNDEVTDWTLASLRVHTFLELLLGLSLDFRFHFSIFPPSATNTYQTSVQFGLWVSLALTLISPALGCFRQKLKENWRLINTQQVSKVVCFLAVLQGFFLHSLALQIP